MANHKKMDLFSENLDQMLHNQSTGNMNDNPELNSMLKTSKRINQIMQPTDLEKRALSNRLSQITNKTSPAAFKRNEMSVRFLQAVRFIGIMILMVGAAVLIFRLYQDLLPQTSPEPPQPASVPTDIPGETVYPFSDKEFIVSIDMYREATFCTAPSR